MPSGPNDRLHQIDVMRGLAALTVVFSHYFPYWHFHFGDLRITVPSAYGYDAVKLFFVISGFVIYMTLEKCRTVVDFAVLRFSRLYPVYWASLSLAALSSTWVFGQQFWAGGFVVNLTMFQQFLGYTNWDNVYWSLTVELAFYLNIAWIFALGLHRRVCLVVAAWLTATILWIAFHPGQVSTAAVDSDEQREALAMLFALDYSPYFALGILSYHGRQHGWSRPLIALVALAIAVEFMLASWEGVIVATTSFALITLALKGWLRFLVCKPTLWLGAISYALYLVHRNVGYQALEWLHEHGVGAALAIAVTVSAALLLATALTYAIERPASGRLRSLYRRIRHRHEAPILAS